MVSMCWLEDLEMFFFPCNCLVCGKSVPSGRAILCLACEYQLPFTRFRSLYDNPVNRIFWGRAPVEAATSLFRFEKGSPYQSLLHELKYRGNRMVGTYLGRLLGTTIRNTPLAGCSLIVPVPLHAARRRKRGYNQSELIARGISDILSVPVAPHILRRRIQHRSQTSVGRYDRFLNVYGNFTGGFHEGELKSKSILLVDDVVTTGATLEACSTILHRQFRCKVMVATVGYA